MNEARVENMDVTSKKPATSTELANMPSMNIEVKNVEISMEEIGKWIAPFGATPKEIYTFGRICQVLNLSPFKKEIHFIKYGSQDATIVVGYTVYIDRAERSGKLDGWHVELDDKEKPTEATITIHRKDWSRPFEWTVYLADVIKLKRDNTPQSTWATQLRFQLKKCTISQGFRLAFPSECAELPYTAEEIGEGSYLPDMPELPKLTVATVTNVAPTVITDFSDAEPAEVNAEVDRDYLRGQYFKRGKAIFGDDVEVRHDWNRTYIGKESTKEMTYDELIKAVDLLKNQHEQHVVIPAPDEDVPESTPTPEGEPEVEMDSAEAVQRKLDANLHSKREEIVLLISDTPIKSIDTPGFATWWKTKLPEEADKDFDDLDVLSLNVIIGCIEAQQDRKADEAAEENGASSGTDKDPDSLF